MWHESITNSNNPFKFHALLQNRKNARRPGWSCGVNTFARHSTTHVMKDLLGIRFRNRALSMNSKVERLAFCFYKACKQKPREAKECIKKPYRQPNTVIKRKSINVISLKCVNTIALGMQLIISASFSRVDVYNYGGGNTNIKVLHPLIINIFYVFISEKVLNLYIHSFCQ